MQANWWHKKCISIQYLLLNRLSQMPSYATLPRVKASITITVISCNGRAIRDVAAGISRAQMASSCRQAGVLEIHITVIPEI